MKTPDLEITLRHRTPPQKKISESKARFNVASWGRQSGKTTFGLDKMLYRPLTGRQNGIYWYVLQTHTAAEVAFNRYWDMVRPHPELLLKKPNESEKFFQLCNGAHVFFKSGEVFDNLRIETLDGCAIDEYRLQDPKLWPMIIRPMLARTKGWCDFLSTPNGFEHFYDLHEAARLDTTGEWAAFNAPSTEAWWWDEKEIASAKSTMSEPEFAQEIMAEFRDFQAGRAYHAYSEHNQLLANPFMQIASDISIYLPVILTCDFNLSPMSWTMGQKRASDFYWFDEIYLENSHTQEAADEFVHRLRLLNPRSTPQVIVCGDATGKAGQRAAAGQSDYDILFKALDSAGISYVSRVPESNPTIKDRVNRVNSKLRAADGSSHCFVNPKRCPMLHKDLQRVVFKKGTSLALDPGSEGKLTHPSDSIGYAMWELDPIAYNSNPGKMMVIRR